MKVRPEDPSLFPHIRMLLLAAFPGAAEADLVERLRKDGSVEIACVALEGCDVIGYVALSRMDAPFRALGLGPVAVRPDRQRQGVGRELIFGALDRARAEGWDAVFVLGDPAYYARFGFDVEAAKGFASPYAGPYFMVSALKAAADPLASGPVSYPPAFAELS